MTGEPEERKDTYVIDPESATEMTRLLYQDRLLTEELGGLFPENPDLSGIHDILDIACGPGGWALDVAFRYPEKQITGVDISQTMVTYAQAQAKARGLSNTDFLVMDVLKPLQFDDNSFDLVNGRLLFGFMPAASWPKLIQECMRILRPGGLLRLTEGEIGITNSPASEEASNLFTRMMKRTGMSFSPDGRHLGLTPMLPRLLREAGFEQVQLKAYAVDYSAGTPNHESHYQNIMIGSKLVQPFLTKLGLISQEKAEEVYQQAMIEMMQDSFVGLWYYLTVSGRKP
ncbi:MAG TPA: methyltransferase domain-containing protein [Ktedonobacteraceae bacterium]|nr:methyltransferase domain-containing protein [Ktedonobacteraceae bacterium]